MRSPYEFNPQDAERFSREQGIGFRRRGDELQLAVCPYCRNKTNDRNTFAINLRTGQFKCLRATCGAHGNMFSLARDFGFSLGTEVDEYYNRQRRFRDMRRYPRPEVRTPAVEYMASRGISKAVTERYAITTRKDADNIIVFPFFDENGDMQFVKYRKADFDKEKDKNKEWSEANCKPILFGMDQCNMQNKTLIMTEGQIDSLSVIEAGLENAVSVPTGAQGFTWVPYCWDFLEKFDVLIVFGDHENGHITLLEDMRRRFHGTVKHVREDDYLECKDANEILRTHGAQAIRNAISNAVPVDNPLIKKMSDVERQDLRNREHFTTGIKELDRKLGGFFFGQVVVLTGERGLGKSTLGSQFVTRAISKGYTTFVYSGEMLDFILQEWLDRQCAGPQRVDAQTSNLGYVYYEVNRSVADQIHDWYENRCFVYDNSALAGEDETESLPQTLEAAIKQYGCRVLLIDNLMTAMEDDMRSDIYRLQTQFVKKLTQLAKVYDVLIILVAHPRKSGAKEFGNDDVSGSSNITNLADVVLNYSEPKEGASDRVLMITKNRLNGRVDRKGIPLWFHEGSKRIAEDPKTQSFCWWLGWEAGQAAEQADEFMDADEFDDSIPF